MIHFPASHVWWHRRVGTVRHPTTLRHRHRHRGGLHPPARQSRSSKAGSAGILDGHLLYVLDGFIVWLYMGIIYVYITFSMGIQLYNTWLCMVTHCYTWFCVFIFCTRMMCWTNMNELWAPAIPFIVALSVVYHLAMLPRVMGPATVVVHVFTNLSSW